jgi:hypothetical protein
LEVQLTRHPGFARLDGSRRIARAPGLIDADVDGDVVVMSLGEGCYFGFDDIASDIWKHLEEGSTLAELIECLAQDYDASRETIENDVSRLLRRMAERDLVVIT